MKKVVLLSLAVLCVVAVGLRLSRTSAEQGVPVVSRDSEPVYPVALGKTANSLRLLTPPSIDGHANDWPFGGMIDLNRNTAYSFSGQIDNTSDLSAIIRSGWDDDWLYFLVEVADDKIVTDSTDVWRDDAVEIGLDGLHDQSPLGWDDHQYTVVADGRTADRAMPTTDIVATVLQYQGGYNIEMAIPILKLIPGTPVSGTVVGFTVGLRDDDDGGSWDAYLIAQGTNTSTSPEQFASLIFVERSEDRLAVLEARIAKLEERIRELLVVLGEFGQVTLPTPAAPTATPTPGPAPTPTATITPVPAETTVTLQQGVGGYYGAEDTYIHQYSPTANYCMERLLRVGANQQYAGIFHFDVSMIPTGAVVTRAALQLYASGWGGLDTTLGTYFILRTVTACEATWNQAQNGNLWGLAGCNNTTTDRRSTAESTVGTSGISKWYTFTLTSAVQSWVDGSLPNNGVLLRAPASELGDFLFAGADHNDPNLRPKLVITYSVPTSLAPGAVTAPSPAMGPVNDDVRTYPHGPGSYL